MKLLTMCLQSAWCCLVFFLHLRSPAAPPAGDGVCPECSLPAGGRLLGHLQRSAQCPVPAVRDGDHAGAAAPTAAETWSVPAQHRPEGGLHTPPADPGHQHRVTATGWFKVLHICILSVWSIQQAVSVFGFAGLMQTSWVPRWCSRCWTYCVVSWRTSCLRQE